MTQPVILIIDDDSRNIFALQAVLRSRNFSCRTATTAEDGLRILEEDNRVKVVLLDIMMPDMDGYEAIAAIRKGVKKTIPVIAVTAKAMAGDREKCLAAGADAYVPKPIDIDVLLNHMENLLKDTRNER
jgi:two-component system, cell cycle response regulator DivK